MKNFKELFLQQLADYRAKCTDEEPIPILELLWENYYQTHPIDDGRIKEIEEKLSPTIDALPFEQSNDVFVLLYNLVDAYQRAAYLEGIQMGVQIATELSL